MTSRYSAEGISIRVLGPQIITRDGEEIPPPAPQQRRVLAVLASQPGEVVAREAIAQRIWGSATAQQVRSLQSYVSHLRTVLGTHAIELVGGGYRLNIEPDQIDEAQFRMHVERGLKEVGEGRFREARRSLQAALELYRGKPYDDLPNGDFAVRRTGLRHLREAAEDALLRMRVDLVRTAQDCDGLIPALAQAYADHPDRELRALLYARTLAMAGRLAEAGDVARDFRMRLKDQTGADPTPEFTETVASLARRDRAALSQAWGSAVDIPPYAGALIGRDVEMHAVVAMLEVGGSPLVTIAGVPGVGKTRLAAAVGAAMADDLVGGVVWVGAEQVTRGDEVIERIAESVGLHGTPTMLRQSLPRTLGERRTLVVVDGVEGAGGDITGALATILGSGPRVCVIVTADGPVGLASEQVLTLQPFATAGGAVWPGGSAKPPLSGSPAAGFLLAMLQQLAPGLNIDMAAVASAVASTSGTPHQLEQAALDLIARAQY